MVQIQQLINDQPRDETLSVSQMNVSLSKNQFTKSKLQAGFAQSFKAVTMVTATYKISIELKHRILRFEKWHSICPQIRCTSPKEGYASCENAIVIG